MAWVKIDHKFHWHKRVRPLSDAAYRLYVGGLCLCNWQETDGEIVEADLVVVAGVMKPRVLAAALAELVTAGLWRRLEDGYGVENYLKFQPSKDAMQAQRDHMSEIGRRGGTSKRTAEAPPLSAPLSDTLKPVSSVTSRPSVSTDRGVRILEWWCERKGWQQVPPSRQAKEFGSAESLATLALSEEELVGVLDEVWDGAKEKPGTLAYFWRPAQVRENEMLKIRKPPTWVAGSILRDLNPNKATA